MTTTNQMQLTERDKDTIIAKLWSNICRRGKALEEIDQYEAACYIDSIFVGLTYGQIKYIISSELKLKN
jgi:hypothetical protein